MSLIGFRSSLTHNGRSAASLNIKHRTEGSKNRLPPMPFNELCIASSLPTLECRLNNKIRRERTGEIEKKRRGKRGREGLNFRSECG
jgi:hypothetical protein